MEKQRTSFGEVLQLPEHVARISPRESPNPDSDSTALSEGTKWKLKMQREALSQIFPSEFSLTEEECQESLLKHALEIEQFIGIHLDPVLIYPGISLQAVAVLRGFDMRCELQDITDWEEREVSAQKKPYILWTAVDRERDLSQAIKEYSKHPFFRVVTVLEAVFASILFPNPLDLKEKIYALGSRIEKMFIPSIGKNSNGRIEIGNPVLPLNNNHLSSVLIAARSF